MKRFNPLLKASAATLTGAYFYNKFNHQPASANTVKSKFNFAVTLNPYFEKRYK